MIKSPLECLKSQSNGFTHVVTLDSWATEPLKLDGDKLWGHLLIEAWGIRGIFYLISRGANKLN